MEINSLRKEYIHKQLRINDLAINPFEQFKAWLGFAIDQNILEANAMTLATATKEGRPSSRTVLLKEIDSRGFIFYTNYQSKKGRDIEENPFGSITIYWKELERQICIDGAVEKVSAEKSINYFHRRPRESQLGAYCSKQGEEIVSRQELMDSYAKFQKQFQGSPIPLPKDWGGYRLLPLCFTFWQGRENRLHDRFIYTPEKNGTWIIKRISP